MNMLAAAAPLARLTRIQLGSFSRSACRRERPNARLFSPPAAAHARWVATADAPPPPRPSTPPKAGKQRLDELTIARYPEFSRTVVQSWIAQGKVLVDGQPVTKAGTKVKSTVVVDIIAEQPKFVCRGGLKLEKALDHFEIDVDGLVCLDSGLSTGGFTDCMLQRGAAKVYGVDVGYGQVAEKIRVHPRAVAATMRNDGSGKLIVLIKPQFEARRSQIGAKGVVRDPAVHEEVIANVVEGAKALGFVYQSHTVSPIKGAKEGNTEFLAYFTRDETRVPPPPEGPSPS